MALTSTEKLQEAFSLALEDRSSGYQDLVSNANVIWHTMKDKGMWQTFSGPTIRERLLFTQSGTYVRYAGADYLSTTRKELINDAEFEPKMGAVTVVLTMEDILKNDGPSQLEDIMTTHIESAEMELPDRFVEDLHGAGALSNQIGGLQKAVPTTVNSGSYGGISRADNAIWRTTTYDLHSFFTGITQFTSTTAQSIYRQSVINRSRNTRGPDLLCADGNHFNAYSAAMEGIQRINDENALGKLGFSNLRFYGAGRSIPVVLEGGIGSAMPSDTTYALDTKSLKFRYHPKRNFQKFGGKQTPINQDMVVQHIGFMGELVLSNPLHTVKIYDSTPAS